MDYIKDSSNPLYPSSLSGINAAALKANLDTYTAPSGWTWSNEYPVGTWNTDPYANWNLANWLNKNKNTGINTGGNYINTINLFSEQALWILNQDILKE